MICKNLKTNEMFNYSFDGQNIILSNKKDSYAVSYDDWTKDYLIISKWRKL